MQPAQTDSMAQGAHFSARPWMQGTHAGLAVSTGRNPSSPTGVEFERLVLADRRKDEFLAMLSHELRSPLGAIRHAIAILRSARGSEPSVQTGMHELIDRQVRQMSLLATGLLDVGALTRGQLQLQRVRIDLLTVLTSAMETVLPETSRRGQAVTTARPRSSVWVFADPNRLEQVFVNLLTNASKYTEEGGEISVSLLELDGSAIVRVRDSGIGIAAHMLPHVFELFVQGPVASTRELSGVGVGLALVQQLVEMHDGSVTALSAGLGQGSEFVVRLRALTPSAA